MDMKAFILGTDDDGGDSDTPKARLIDQRYSGREPTVHGLKTGPLVGVFGSSNPKDMVEGESAAKYCALR